MICEKCGMQLPENAKYCNECGASLFIKNSSIFYVEYTKSFSTISSLKLILDKVSYERIYNDVIAKMEAHYIQKYFEKFIKKLNTYKSVSNTEISSYIGYANETFLRAIIEVSSNEGYQIQTLSQTGDGNTTNVTLMGKL